ncbi:MAG: transcriptional repressor [Pseudonocardia sp.]|nr:transcriptional repressor [Pseudonocardia sp.]
MERTADRLRAAGLRVTRPRLAVLAEVAEHPHADVASIAVGARARLGSLSTQAIYDVVHAMTGVGLLRRIEPAGSPARFEVQTGDNHHHLVCRACGAIVDVEHTTGQAPNLNAGDDAGFLVDQAEVTYWGLCPCCQPNQGSSDTPATTTPSSTH